MKLSPYSFNGTVINGSTNYDSWIERGNAPGAPGADARFIKRPGAWPVYTGKDFQSVIYTLSIEAKQGADGWEALNRLFYTGDEETHLFIIKDEDDSDRQYQVYATPTGQPTFGNQGTTYTVKLAFDDPIWQGVDLQSSTWAITGSTDTKTITPAGNMDTYPIFTITPTQAPSTDYRFMAFVRVLPQSANPWPHRPLDIVGSTDASIVFDTSTLVSTGEMLASGNDLRVFVDGTEVDRWLAFPSSTNTPATSTDTHVWIVTDMPPAREMTLNATITSGSTSLEVPNTFTNRKLVDDCPASGWLVLDSAYGSSDSEDVFYSEKTITDAAIGFVLASRGARDTAAMAHTAGANVRFMPHDIRMVWEDADAIAPDVDDRKKPLILNSALSRNNNFVYSGAFIDANQIAPDMWKASVRRISNEWGRSNVFTTTDTIASTDLSLEFSPIYPATMMGGKVGSYQLSGVWRYDSAVITWENTFPDGIDSLPANTVAYDSFSSTVTANIAKAEIRVSGGEFLRGSIQSDSRLVRTTTMAGSGSWGSVLVGTQTTIPAGMTCILVVIYGASGPDELDWLGMGVETFQIPLTNPPHVAYWNATAGSHVHLDMTLTNATTGESLRIVAPMLENDVLVVDCNPDFPTMKINGASFGEKIDLNTTRGPWMTLLGAANVINYQCNLNAAFESSITTSWRNRMAYL